MFIIKHKNFVFFLSVSLVLSSLFSIAFFRPWNFGIEFTGGSLLEVSYPDGRPVAETLRTNLAVLNWTGTQVQETGDTGYIIRTKDLTEQERQSLMSVVSDNSATKIDVSRFNSIGPTIGSELRSKAGWAILFVIVAIVLYIAFAFRGVSFPISSWVYGLVALVRSEER